MIEVPEKPRMVVRLRGAVVWLIPFAVLLVVRILLQVPDEFLAMPANGIPPTRLDGVINVLFAASLWFGAQAFLATLVWDDCPGLAGVLVGMMALQSPFFVCVMLSVLFT